MECLEKGRSISQLLLSSFRVQVNGSGQPSRLSGIRKGRQSAHLRVIVVWLFLPKGVFTVCFLSVPSSCKISLGCSSNVILDQFANNEMHTGFSELRDKSVWSNAGYF
jgi:hypothetical protein